MSTLLAEATHLPRAYSIRMVSGGSPVKPRTADERKFWETGLSSSVEINKQRDIYRMWTKISSETLPYR